MKTKIKTISPDQNIIEHESGLRTVFVETNDITENCEMCIYRQNKNCWSTGKPCDPYSRTDIKWGYFTKLIEP